MYHLRKSFRDNRNSLAFSSCEKLKAFWGSGSNAGAGKVGQSYGQLQTPQSGFPAEWGLPYSDEPDCKGSCTSISSGLLGSSTCISDRRISLPRFHYLG